MGLRRFILYAAGAINDASLLGNNVVTNAAMADNAIGNAELADDAVSAAEIAANAIGDSELDTTAGFNFTGNIQLNGVALTAGDLFYAVVVARRSTSISDLAAGAPSTVDGVSLSANDDVLYDPGSSASAGIYNVDTVGSGSDGAWTRAEERNSAAELPVGMVVYVKGGTSFGQKLYRLNAFAGTLGTNPLTFEEVEEGLTPAGGSGEPLAVGTGDGSTLTFNLGGSGVVWAAVIVDGIQQAPSTYSISAGTGAGGVDQLVFGSGNAPADGAAIEMIAFTRS